MEEDNLEKELLKIQINDHTYTYNDTILIKSRNASNPCTGEADRKGYTHFTRGGTKLHLGRKLLRWFRFLTKTRKYPQT